MKKQRLGNIKYESRSVEEILFKLKEVPRIVITETNKGIDYATRKGYFVPGLVSNSTMFPLIEASGYWEGGIYFNPLHGFNIRARRVSKSLSQKALRILGRSKSEEIEDIVEYTENALGIKSFRKVSEQEYIQSVKEYNKYHMPQTIKKPFLQYIKKIGELDRKLTLFTDDFKEKDISLNNYKGDLVIPTTILFGK